MYGMIYETGMGPYHPREWWNRDVAPTVNSRRVPGTIGQERARGPPRLMACPKIRARNTLDIKSLAFAGNQAAEGEKGLRGHL